MSFQLRPTGRGFFLYKKQYPSAVRCFEEDFEARVAHLYCPPAHRKECPVDENFLASEFCPDNPSKADCCVCPDGSTIHGLPAGYRICRS